MKNRPFSARFRFAGKGIASAFKTEANFRFQLTAAVGAIGVLLFLRPAPLWWAIFALTISGVLGSELINTALEHTLDRLHPERDPLIALAKDCAAGAVLVFSLASLVVMAALLIERFAQ